MRGIWTKVKDFFVPNRRLKTQGNIGAGSLNPEVVGSLESSAHATISTQTICPYCGSADFVKRGVRKKKYEVVQLYICRIETCGRTFTEGKVKGKRFPLNVILEGISYYNLGLSLEQTCQILKEKFSTNENIIAPTPATLSAWIEEYKGLCRFERMRPWAVKMFPPQKMIEVVTMAHRQLYRFRYHRAKTMLMLEEFKNRRFGPLKEYLDNVSSETPHQYFQDGERMSEIRSKFDKTGMIVKSKSNFANKIADLALRAASENKDRHEVLQRFMIANDSVTVATEVPVYIRREDVEHMENKLKFKITTDGRIELKGGKQVQKFPRLLTGHIDFIQIRNGMVHILDYKPNTSKEHPIEQLTWYALALSRLTGLRLFEFKCAWFDDKDFYEFYPLHVVKKLQIKKKKRRIFYRDGSVVKIPRGDVLKVVK